MGQCVGHLPRGRVLAVLRLQRCDFRLRQPSHRFANPPLLVPFAGDKFLREDHAGAPPDHLVGQGLGPVVHRLLHRGLRVHAREVGHGAEQVVARRLLRQFFALDHGGPPRAERRHPKARLLVLGRFLLHGLLPQCFHLGHLRELRGAQGEREGAFPKEEVRLLLDVLDAGPGVAVQASVGQGGDGRRYGLRRLAYRQRGHAVLRLPALAGILDRRVRRLADRVAAVLLPGLRQYLVEESRR
mmetsp:Transcript_76524/g.221160  ORF Transcript_76524/g.221160 Transcript_76524/m.221160 type:complete len:242 (+) Transcript_76524:1942-2667(+)